MDKKPDFYCFSHLAENLHKNLGVSRLINYTINFPFPCSSMLIIFQHLLLLFDLTVSSILFLLLQNKIVLLIFVVLQDIGLILSLTLYFVSFINTSYFKAGFILPLILKFWLTLLTILLYVILSVVFQAVFLSHTWNRLDGYATAWSPLVQVFYVLQRSLAVLFYYSYKRTSLQICTPQFYNTDLLFESN